MMFPVQEDLVAPAVKAMSKQAGPEGLAATAERPVKAALSLCQRRALSTQIQLMLTAAILQALEVTVETVVPRILALKLPALAARLVMVGQLEVVAPSS